MKKSGRVTLVGAGPGDPELLTLRGCSALKNADVVLYDALIDTQILNWARTSAKKIFTGKRGFKQKKKIRSIEKHSTEQDAINQLILFWAKKGKHVVRLKGGDPFVFGRGGEEAEFCVQHNIPVTVVPGVSSAIAAPASIGIPVTDRRYNSSVTFLTGHGIGSKGTPRIDWEKLSPKQTLVVLMGMAHIKKIVNKLLKQRWSKKTPVAIIQWATTDKQRQMITTLQNLPQDLDKAHPPFESPAVVVIGSVVNLSRVLDASQRINHRNDK